MAAADVPVLVPDRTLRGPTVARRRWFVGVLALTVVPLVALPALATSAGPAPAVGWLLFLGSSVHVASTGWFWSDAETRTHMLGRRRRFIGTPVALVGVGIAGALWLPTRALAVTTLLLFGWQFVHFQKQNLGLVALTARAYGGRVTPAQRRILVGTGVAAVLALAGRPQLLQLGRVPSVGPLFVLGAVLYVGALAASCVTVLRAGASAMSPQAAAVYACSLLFVAPVWLFASPYAAVAGLTIAHGLQYLMLMGLVARGEQAGRQRRVGVVVLIDIAVLAGVALNRMSHLHNGGGLDHALYGVYLGLTAAHLVMDAGLWRLRDRFVRAFLTARLPFLLGDARQL